MDDGTNTTPPSPLPAEITNQRFRLVVRQKDDVSSGMQKLEVRIWEGASKEPTMYVKFPAQADPSEFLVPLAGRMGRAEPENVKALRALILEIAQTVRAAHGVADDGRLLH